VSSDSLEIEQLIDQSIQHRNSNTDSALYFARLAMGHINVSYYPSLRELTYNQLGIIYRYLGALDSAEFYYTKCLEIRAQAGDSLRMALTWHNLAIIARKKGAYSKAINYELMSLPFIKRSGDSISLGHVYTGLGNIYSVQKNWERAVENYLLGLQIQQSIGNKTGHARLLYNLGIVRYEQGQHSMADSLFRRSMGLSEKLENKRAIANVNHSLGVLQQELGNLNAAASFFNKALEVHLQMGDQEGMLYSLISLGELNFINANWNRAKTIYEQAIDLSIKTGLKEEELMARKGLAQSLESLHDWKTANEQWKKSISLQDTLRNATTNKRILELQEKYETEKQGRENLLLLRDNEIKAQQLRVKDQSLNFRTTLLMIALILLFLILLLLFNYWKRVQTGRLLVEQRELLNQQKMLDLIREQELAFINATQIGQETERKRIAADLHDGLSNMLVTVKLYFENLGDRLLPAQPHILENYNEAVEMLDKICQRARNLTHEIASETSSFSLKPALVEMVAIINKTGHLKTELSVFGLEKPMNRAVEHAIFYILRELIGNTMKHAQAQQLFIQLTRYDHQLILMVEDDGRGFETEKAKNSDGMGLPNLSSRILDFDGTLHIDSVPGRGTNVTIELPFLDNRAFNSH